MAEEGEKPKKAGKAKGARGTGVRAILIGALADGKEKQFKDLLLHTRQEYEKTHGKLGDKPFKIGRALAGLEKERMVRKLKSKGRGWWQKDPRGPIAKKKKKASPKKEKVKEEAKEAENVS